MKNQETTDSRFAGIPLSTVSTWKMRTETPDNLIDETKEKLKELCTLLNDEKPQVRCEMIFSEVAEMKMSDLSGGRELSVLIGNLSDVAPLWVDMSPVEKILEAWMVFIATPS